MANYKIHLVALGGVTVNRSSVGGVLKGFVDRVIRGGGHGLSTRFSGGSQVIWTTSCPAVQQHELLIYIVSTSLDSVVSGLAGSPGRDGLTAWRGTQTGSEVYVKRNSAALVARLAFHEAMHNKSHSGNGLHGQNGLAQETITETTALTSQNIRFMGRYLGRNRSQWTGGCAYYNDPLRGL